MKCKKLLLFLFVISSCFFISCNKKIEPDLSETYVDNRNILAESNASDFVLCTKNGTMALHDVNGKVLDTLKLSGSSKSDFLYCEDSGDIYSKNLLSNTEFNCMLYAVDRRDGQLYLVRNSGNKLKIVDTISLKASSNIEEIKAFNGVFYYLVKGNGLESREFTVAKISNVLGIVDYLQDVGVERRGKTYSYIYVQNLSKDYLNHLGLDKKLTDNDISNMNITSIKKDVIRIPYDIDSWAPTNNSIIYCAKDVYGSYELETDILSACYGSDSSTQLVYRSGKYSNAFALNQMGPNSSKSILMQIDPDNLNVDNIYEYSENQPMDMYVDTTLNVLYITYKVDNKATYSKLKIIDLNTFEEINNITFDFVPTQVKGHNGYYYVLNAYEDFIAVGMNGAKEYNIFNKYVKDVNANDVLVCNIYKKDYFTYDANGRYISEDGKFLDYRGNLINNVHQKINKFGQLLDGYGRAVNTNGELVDRYGNIVDENGVIIQYTQQADGYYRSAKGIVVDVTGKKMIRQEDGSYIEDIEVIPDLEWHYDENGNVVINQDYLDKYPDAASWINKDGKVTKGSYQDDGKADEIEEKADETILDKLIFWK